MTSPSGKINLRMAGALMLGISVLLVLSFGMSWFHSHKIENNTRTEVIRQLEIKGFEAPEIIVTGRVARFLGNVDAHIDRKQMIEIAAGVAGVEEVIDERVVTNYVTGRRFELHSYAGITTVEGELPEQSDIDLVIAAIRDHYGVDPLGANLRLHSAVKRPPWLDELKKILGILGSVSPLELEYTNSKLYVTGTVEDEKILHQVVTALQVHLGEKAKLDVRLQLPSKVKYPNLKIEYKRGQIFVHGLIPDEIYSHKLEAALSLAFAVKHIDNQLQIDEDVHRSSWLDGALRVVFPLAMTKWLEFEIRENEIVVQGAVRDDSELMIVREQIQENFDHEIRIVNLIKTQPTPD